MAILTFPTAPQRRTYTWFAVTNAVTFPTMNIGGLATDIADRVAKGNLGTARAALTLNQPHLPGADQMTDRHLQAAFDDIDMAVSLLALLECGPAGPHVSLARKRVDEATLLFEAVETRYEMIFPSTLTDDTDIDC